MKYIGIKIVDAIPMNSIVAHTNGYRVPQYPLDEVNGYEVTYEDGYKSWCPKETFDKHNYKIKNDELASTCEMMVSPDYKKRFLAELTQLKNRYYGLVKMLDDWDESKLNFTPTCPRETYNFQLKAMKEYLDILTIRAKIENIVEN